MLTVNYPISVNSGMLYYIYAVAIVLSRLHLSVVVANEAMRERYHNNVDSNRYRSRDWRNKDVEAAPYGRSRDSGIDRQSLIDSSSRFKTAFDDIAENTGNFVLGSGSIRRGHNNDEVNDDPRQQYQSTSRDNNYDNNNYRHHPRSREEESFQNSPRRSSKRRKYSSSRQQGEVGPEDISASSGLSLDDSTRQRPSYGSAAARTVPRFSSMSINGNEGQNELLVQNVHATVKDDMTSSASLYKNNNNHLLDDRRQSDDYRRYAPKNRASHPSRRTLESTNYNDQPERQNHRYRHHGGRQLSGGNRKNEANKNTKDHFSKYPYNDKHCPGHPDGFLCPTPDHAGMYKCVSKTQLCNGNRDCARGEDEDHVACMFYKATQSLLTKALDLIEDVANKLQRVPKYPRSHTFYRRHHNRNRGRYRRQHYDFETEL